MEPYEIAAFLGAVEVVLEHARPGHAVTVQQAGVVCRPAAAGRGADDHEVGRRPADARGAARAAAPPAHAAVYPVRVRHAGVRDARGGRGARAVLAGPAAPAAGRPPPPAPGGGGARRSPPARGGGWSAKGGGAARVALLLSGAPTVGVSL